METPVKCPTCDALRDAARLQAIGDSERITALRAELDMAEATAESWQSQFCAAIDQRDALRAEVEALRKEAGDYAMALAVIANGAYRGDLGEFIDAALRKGP